MRTGSMYAAPSACQWRAIPKDLPPKSTVHDYFDLWTYYGTLKRIHHVFMSSVVNKSNEKP